MTKTFVVLVTLVTSCFGRPEIREVAGGIEGVRFPQKDIEFVAFRLEPIHKSRGAHSPIIFEGLKQNDGNYYDLTTGYFTAPCDGLYVFNLTSYVTIERRVRLMKNDYEVRMLSNDGKGTAKRSLKGEILLQLQEGDRIWLRLAREKRTGSVNTSPDSTLMTFSGRLLTTDVHILETASSHQGRLKRSPTASDSLKRKIREANYVPVSLVERGAVRPDSALQGSGNHDVTGVSTNQKIAFSVTCTKSMIGGHMADTTESLDGDMSPDAAPNGRIGFDKTFVNIGDGFDIDNAEFIAPTDGVYFFSFNVGKFPRKKLSVMLMKNFNEIQSIVYNDSRSRARGIQGQSLMLQLRKDDRIWLRSYNGEDYAVYSNLGNYITFSGYLVYSL